MKYFILVVILAVASTSNANDNKTKNPFVKVDESAQSYLTHCARCHHQNKIGLTGPPLLSKNLTKYNDEKLAKAIRNGFPNTLMPAYIHLSNKEMKQIISYLRKDNGSIKYSLDDIIKSRKIYKNQRKNLYIKNIRNITPVVERDANKVWVMEDNKILAKFDVSNVHGGIKYLMNGSAIFVPSRDGKITKISLKDGRVEGEIKACVNMRNIAVSRDDKTLFATCLLPKNIVVIDTATLNPKKIIDINGTISSLYDLYSQDKALFTLRDRAKLGILDTKKYNIVYRDLKEPFEDFFIDPFEQFIIGSSRGGKLLSVYDLKNQTYPFEYSIGGMPHLFSATYWYDNGKYYFASPHLGQNYISIWQMYDWKLIKQIDIDGSGFFAKTHPATPFIFADNGTDTLSLIDKKSFEVTTLKPLKGKKFNHTEFSGDGKYTYLSIYENDGFIKVYDTKTMKELAAYPANMPVGKYNFVNKNRVLMKDLLK